MDTSKLLKLIVLATLCSANVSHQCRTKTLAYDRNLDVERALGPWYMATMWSGMAEHKDYLLQFTCQILNITKNNEPLVLSREQTYLDLTDGMNMILTTTEGIVVDSNETSVWHIVSYEGMETSDTMIWIDTDYEDWKLVYNCYPMDSGNDLEILSFFTRSPQRVPTEDIGDIIYNLITKNGFLPENQIIIDRNLCLTYNLF